MDAGPIILNLSPSGSAFAIGSATYFGDDDLRNKLLRTAEIAGHTIKWGDHRHYLLADIALVGEAITLAMRTNTIDIHRNFLNSSGSGASTETGSFETGWVNSILRARREMPPSGLLLRAPYLRSPFMGCPIPES